MKRGLVIKKRRNILKKKEERELNLYPLFQLFSSILLFRPDYEDDDDFFSFLNKISNRELKNIKKHFWLTQVTLVFLR